ncbi:hypothetical protein [Pseudomonas segetis]|uniref:Uncharacterized protein n=1 Tax=Pseudomonas segetis TaxID=298908 RepID=A0A239JP13_9PSED|nr:hypothetical protein [Pseudomonas segetis]SNT07158.1 hypothetical protein SAMN05216255_4420 [Pseudomonas segetis]
MQRYHDTRNDPLPLHSTEQDAERLRLELATEAFLAKGGKVKQVGHQMRDELLPFVINPASTPVYSHLFVKPETEQVQAKPMPKPSAVSVKPPVMAEVLQPLRVEGRIVEPKTPRAELTAQQIAARLMAQAALGASPSTAADIIGITEKHARQVARDFHIIFKRQR